MKTAIVSRNRWSDFFYEIYKQSYKGSTTTEVLLELYGIDRWDKIDIDSCKITFIDEKKMIYWLLRWS